MIYELRVYTVMPGRMRDLVARFERMNIPVFARHGIRAVGYWTNAIGDSSEFTYMLAWESWTDRDAKWGAFIADPEMHRAIAESETNGVIVQTARNQIMQTTAFSPQP